MIISDIETTEKVEYEDLLKNYYEKMEIIEKQDKEIERLNKCYCERTDCSGRIKNSKKYESMQEEIERLHSIIKEVRYNLENSIKSINEKLRNNKEPFEVIDGKIQYINDYRVVRLKAFRTKCKELLEILDKENI